MRDEAEARDLSLAAAVVDSAGHVLASQRMDGAALGAMRLAAGKAFTAASWATPTGEFTRSTQPGGDDWGWNTTDGGSSCTRAAFRCSRTASSSAVGGERRNAGEDEACVAAAATALGFD